jgi:hypothetical protein
MSVTGFGGEGLVAGRDGEMGATPQGSGADKTVSSSDLNLHMQTAHMSERERRQQ